jgi:replicative DNA helicase
MTLDTTDKLFSKPAEAAVLGSMIQDPQCVGETIRTLPEEDDFFVEAHRLIYRGIVAVWIETPLFDGLMIRDWLVRHDLLERIGGVEYLQKVVDSVPCSTNCKYYTNIVADRRRYRDLIRAHESMSKIIDEGDDVTEQVSEIQRVAMELESQEPDTVFTVAQHATDVALAAQDESNVIPTGLNNLDALIGGVGPGDLIVPAGRPSMGKSALASQMGLNIAATGKSVIYFTLEMTGPALIERMIAQQSKINPHRLTPEPSQVIRDAWYQASLDLERMDITVVEAHDTVEKQRAYLRSRKHDHGIDVVIIDYMQLMTAKGQSRYEQVTTISRQLKRMALIEGVPVIALSQLNRACEARTDHRPQMGDLRESGGIEQDADTVILLHREDYYRRQDLQADQRTKDGTAEAIVAKNRRGPVGVAELVFIDECFGFGDRIRGFTG